MVSLSGNQKVGAKKMSNLLNVENLEIKFRTADGTLPAVRNISFSVDREETLCIVGESGSGKSITSIIYYGSSTTMVILQKVYLFRR